MTRGKKLVLLLLVLAILMVATILVMELVPDDQTSEEETAYTIFTLDMDQVTGLSWTYDGEEVTLARDEENNWTYPADGAFPLD